MSDMTETELQTGREKRLESARKALTEGLWTFTPAAPDCWKVRSANDTYDLGLSNGRWFCTCPDNTRYRQYGLDCKHIHGLRLWLAQSGNGNQTCKSEETRRTILGISPTFDQQTSEGNPMTENQSTSTILERLRQPLDMSRVKRRAAPGQGTVPYLEGYDVIETANDIFEFAWSFDLLSEPRILRWDKVVTVYDQRLRKKVPVLGEDGKPTTEIAGIVYVTGRVTIELQGRAYVHADAGRCVFSGDTPEALDMAIAGAVTDCLKRCFRQSGEQFGNSLYDKEIARVAGTETSLIETKAQKRSGNRHPSNGNGNNGHKPGQSPSASPSPTPTATVKEQRSADLESARATACPFGTTQNPQIKGMKLGDVAALPIGAKVLSYLANE